ncbi:MAG: adenylate kinase [Pedosphaera sp.]|nr:adenylate kinase [Pedosphaera sp.]
MAENKCAVVIMGPPGSGKTTLVRSLTARGRISEIEAGNLLGDEVRRDTPLGRQIRPYQVAGELVPSELVQQVIAARLEKADGQFVLFDGFPRSAAQIGILFQLLKEHHLQLCAVIVLNVELQTALERITGRRICPDCGAIYNVYTEPPQQAGICDRCGGKLMQREDDRLEVVQERFKVYERDTIPTVEFFRKEFGLVTWEESANSTPDELLERVSRRLEKAVPQLDLRENPPARDDLPSH